MGLIRTATNCHNGSNSTQAGTGFVNGLPSSEPGDRERADPGDVGWPDPPRFATLATQPCIYILFNIRCEEWL